AWAEQEFHAGFFKSSAGEVARRYMTDRGFTDETLREFRIGCQPGGWEWLLDRARPKFTVDDLKAARLVSERREGNGCYDFFRGRVMFPIRDERGRTVAFGGRVLPGLDHGDAGKYLNSAESSFFTKSRMLYGFDLAKMAIREAGAAVVVEGYTDCMMARQCGLRNVVATLGTALTADHVVLLKRFARRVVLVYDGDKAGQDATEKALAKLLSQDIDLRILTLPAGQDPADFLAEHGAEAFGQLAAGAVEAWEYKLARCLDRFGLDSVDGAEQVLAEMLDVLAQVPRLSGTPREDLILSRLGQRLGLDVRAVRRRLDEIRGKAASRAARHKTDSAPEQTVDPARRRNDAIEAEILEILFVDPSAAETVFRQIGPEDFRNPELRSLLSNYHALLEQGAATNYDRLLMEVEDVELKRLATQLLDQAVEKQRQSFGRENAWEPRFVQQAVARIVLRREQELHEQSNRQRAQRLSTQGQTAPASGNVLDSDVREQLRMGYEFHQKRAT
ncbi:MAG: DNA primase, partial [Planctomycetaceae bacterium]